MLRGICKFGGALLFVAFVPQAVASDALVCVQQALTQLGYDAGPSDGAMGRRTTSASKALAADFQLTLPDLGEASASQWCDSTKAISASPEAALLTSKARFILPVDVLVNLNRAPVTEAQRLCGANLTDTALETKPIMKISGFTSRMSDVADLVPNARELARFTGVFGAQSVMALATRDAALKTKLVKVLAKWADAGALLETISCVRPDASLITTGKCTEWTVADGSDRSGMKDATFVTFLGVGLIRAYYTALADADPEGLSAEHKSIANWIDKFSKRLKRPEKVYFGFNMGWYWPAIINDLSTGKTERARQRLGKVEAGLIRQIHQDGSIEERTTRGDRALWYHFTAVNEIMVSMEMMRAAGMVPSEKLEKLLHGTVQLFVSAVKDPDNFMAPWAKSNVRARYKGKQEWDRYRWPNGDMSGTWLYAYQYRYPDTPAAKELAKLVPPTARTATVDNDLGLGLGCVYNTAALGRP